MDPGNIFQNAWLIEIEDKARGEHIGGFLTNHHRAPRRVTWRLHTALIARGIGAEPRTENKGRVIEIQVHGRIVERRDLMDVDV